MFVFLITIPTVIALTGIILGAKKFKGLLTVSFLYVLILVVLAINGKLVFITKYSIEILPVLILTTVSGLYNKNKFTKILLYFFIFINLTAFFTASYPSKQMRNEGHNIPCAILNYQKPEHIIFTYYALNRFYRYLKTKSETNSVDKTNRKEYETVLPSLFADIKKGETLSAVFLDSVSFIPQNYIIEAKKQNIPEMFITFSLIRHFTENEFTNNFKDIKIMNIGSWTVINGIKK